MKKLNSMRTAAVLSMAVLTTTAVVGGSFAKYHAGATPNDTARAAKWGVTVSATGDQAFSTTYATDDTSGILTSANSVISSSADSDPKKKVIAPGTKGSLGGYEITGTPEVAVAVTKTADLKVENWIVYPDENDPSQSVFYCPITIEVGGTEYCGLNYESAEAFEADIESAISADKKALAPNTNLKSSNNYKWEWAFEGATGTSINQSDDYDSLLGSATKAPTISLNVAIDVTQID